MKRLAAVCLLFGSLLFCVAARAQSDSMIHVNQFPGVTVGDKVAAAMPHCPAAPVPCILVIDASLAAAAPGTIPTLCDTCSLLDYRFGSTFVVRVQTVAALTAAISAGESVQVAAGNYVLSAPLVLASNTSIFCDSWGSHFTFPGSVGTANMVTISGASHVSVRGCFFDGSGMTTATQDAHLIRVVSSSNVQIDGNYLLNSPEDAIRVGASLGGGSGTSVQITNNYIESPGQVGPSGSCVGADSITQSLIANNVCITPKLDGIDIEPNAASSAGSFLTITGNVISTSAAASAGNGISLFNGGASPSNDTVTGNSVSGFGQAAGIVLSGAYKNAIAGNTIDGNLLGIQLKSTSYSNEIAGNQLDSDVTGISFEGSSHDNESRGNHISNATTAVQEISGANHDYSFDSFDSNTSNVGTVSSTFTLAVPGNGAYTFYSTQQTVGTTFSEGTEWVKALPNPSAGAFAPNVQANVPTLLGNGSVLLAGSGASSNGLECVGATGTCTTWGNWTFGGTVAVNGGSNVLYRCTVAGTLPIGALTTNTANCGSSGTADTGLRVK